MQVQMIAMEKFPYGDRDLVVGDEFTASESDARVLSMVGRAQYVRAVKVKEENEEKGDRKGRYHRRDVRAEE